MGDLEGAAAGRRALTNHVICDIAFLDRYLRGGDGGRNTKELFA